MSQAPREVGREVVRREAAALSKLADALGDDFEHAVEKVLACPGRVVLCGIGKSGQIAQKIASTMVSTGTPAGFLHPVEGFHGDVGILTSRDVVIAISNSGTTREVLDLVGVVRTLGASVIAFTGTRDNPLARSADVAVAWGDVPEADPMGLVPTVSAALALALGDALTVAVMVRRGFGAKDYALVHPSGAIGRRLNLRVVDLLRGPETNPVVTDAATFGAALETVTRHTLGATSVVDGEGRLVGLVTDGDVRRAIAAASGSVRDLLARPVSDFMTRTPTSIAPDALAFDAMRVMETHRPRPILVLPVVDPEGRAVGMIRLHDLVQAGLSRGVDA